MAKKFLRRDSARYSKLGKRKKKKQKWNKPKGRDNKMREKRRGYPKVVSIGYKKEKKLRKSAIIVRNVKDLEKVDKNKIIIVGKVGKKKKIEIVKKAKEMKIELRNVNVEKFLEEISKAKALDNKKDNKVKTDDKVEQSPKKDEKLTTKKMTEPKGEANKENKK